MEADPVVFPDANFFVQCTGYTLGEIYYYSWLTFLSLVGSNLRKLCSFAAALLTNSAKLIIPMKQNLRARSRRYLGCVLSGVCRSVFRPAWGVSSAECVRSVLLRAWGVSSAGCAGQCSNVPLVWPQRSVCRSVFRRASGVSSAVCVGQC